MRDPNDAIERVLTGLRNCPAPDGLERRVLAAARARASVQPARHVWGWAAAAAAVIACCITLGVMLSQRAVQTQSRLYAIPERPRNLAGPSGGAKDANYRTQEAAAPKRFRTNVRNARMVRTVGAGNSVTLREMRAASHPAPEEPLTQEEKLLLRVVHTGNPHGLAMLDPEVRARQDAEQTAEFEKFVEQSIRTNKGESE